MIRAVSATPLAPKYFNSRLLEVEGAANAEVLAAERTAASAKVKVFMLVMGTGMVR